MILCIHGFAFNYKQKERISNIKLHYLIYKNILLNVNILIQNRITCFI